MPSPIPLLDVPGFTRRTIMPPATVALIQARTPGYLDSRIAVRQSWIESRLRKRYAARLPFGQAPAQPRALGTSPPLATLLGAPALGCVEIRIEVTTGGAVGVALFRWSADGGLTWTGTGVAIAATVTLGTTGLSVAFDPLGTYATDNVYRAATPVPETVLGWLAALVTVDAYDRIGRDPSDPVLQTEKERYDAAVAELKEAADQDTGLFELPVNDGAPATSAVDVGGPFFYSEPDAFRWMDRQREASRGR
jgi:hypothetical protein